MFGVSSDEYLNYALQNRNEWKDRGHEIVLEMVERVKSREFNATEANRKARVEGRLVKKFPATSKPSDYQMSRQYSM